MIECIFTIDYEIYGNGEGSLKELVYEPAQRLKELFLRSHERFVVFVEAAELEMIEAQGTDPAIDLVKNQIRDFCSEGFELGLHLHPQWYNGRFENGRWHLDYKEYNLCTLPRERIVQILDRSITYFRDIVGIAHSTPLAFRAGNWLFQPTQTLANALAERGIKVDSSVFKGGMQKQQKLDYRRASKNGYFWKFYGDVNSPDSKGILFELPIYTQMVPFWRMLTKKRIGLQQKGASGSRTAKQRLYRFLDMARFRYPLKLDFCRMTIDELIRMAEPVIKEDRQDPTLFKPIVAIGHTKDLVDFKAVESFLSYLGKEGIRISSFQTVYERCFN